MNSKRIRMLLRVSSNQQLETDGDLTIQRQIILDYIKKHEDWVLDGKEYFEGGTSGYKNNVDCRDKLQEALKDARNGEYDILVVYKDDRIGRLMWEIGAYVMTLKNYGVDIYTVKDNCISPASDDIMGQMMLALRFGNAQKSSSDTGMRVKDTAQKLVAKGRFMGGNAPYGYELVVSGELSKHGRMLRRLQIIPERAKVVKHIYDLSLNKEYGSAKIARLLNEDEHYKNMAPKDTWKSGTITSILTNPIYAGHVAYKRRERINGKYHRLDEKEWIRSNEPDENIQIIDGETWDKIQDKRKCRSDKYMDALKHKKVTVIKRNDGMLSLIDVAHCGYCGRKLTNGTKYSYWTIKDTGERRASKTPVYRCQAAQLGIPHNKVNQFRADNIEKIVFGYLGECISKMLEKEDIMIAFEHIQSKEKMAVEAEIRKLKKESDKIVNGITIMQEHIPDAMTGGYALSVEELANAIHRMQEKADEQQKVIAEKEKMLKQTSAAKNEGEKWKENPPAWKQLFKEADRQTHRILANKLIEQISIMQGKLVIRLKVNLNDFYPDIE